MDDKKVTDQEICSVVDSLESRYSQAIIFEDAFRASPLPSAVVELDGTLKEVNHAFAHALGYEVDEIIGTTWMDHTIGQSTIDDLKLVEKCLTGEIVSYDLDKIYRHKEGYHISAILFVTIIKGSNSFFLSQFITKQRILGGAWKIGEH